MWAAYEKNIYTAQEVAKAMINVDNSQCSLAVTRVKFYVEQRCTIRTRGFGNHQHVYVKKLAYQEQPGPDFGQGGFQTEMLIDLNTIRYQVN